MGVKDSALRFAALDTLAKAVAAELKAARAELHAELRAAKQETGTQQISISMPTGEDIGKASLVSHKPKAVVTDEAALLQWVHQVAKVEISSRIVTEIRPAWLKSVLDQLTAAGSLEWADPVTGVVHEVPGVKLQPQASTVSVRLGDENRGRLMTALRAGVLNPLGEIEGEAQ